MEPKPKTNLEREKNPREKPLKVDMPFQELLARIVRVKPPRKELK